MEELDDNLSPEGDRSNEQSHTQADSYINNRYESGERAFMENDDIDEDHQANNQIDETEATENQQLPDGDDETSKNIFSAKSNESVPNDSSSLKSNSSDNIEEENTEDSEIFSGFSEEALPKSFKEAFSSVTNKDNVENQVNIGSIQGNPIFEIIGESQSNIVVEELSSIPHSFPIYKDRNYTEAVQRLLEEHITMLSCVDDEVCNAIMYTFLQENGLSDKKQYIIHIEQSDNVSMNQLYSHDLCGEQEAIFILRILDSNLDCSIHNNPPWMWNTKNKLNDEKRYFIFLVNPTSVDTYSILGKNNTLHCWNIDFLPHLLSKYFESNEISLLCDKILFQKRLKLWDNGESSDTYFYNLVRSFLDRGKITFLHEVELRNEFQEGDDVEHFKETRLKKINLNELLETELHVMVAFVATFFSDSTWGEFEKLLTFFIAEETQEVEKSRTTQTDAGDLKSFIEKIEVPLLDIWKREGDHIFERCNLAVSSSSEESHYVTFKDPYMAEELKRYFESKPVFLSRCFRAIYERGLLFEKLSPHLGDSLTQFYARMAVRSHGQLQSGWLMEHLTAGLNAIGSNPSEQSHVMDQRMAFINLIKYHQKSQHILYPRIAGILRELLNFESQKDAVDSFLRNLIQLNDPSALPLILRVARRLSYAPEFDWLKFIKQIIEQGKDNSRLLAYGALLLYAQQNAHNILDLLEQLDTWLPKTKVDTFTPSQTVAIQLAFDYTIKSTDSLSASSYGYWPSRYPLFSNFWSSQEGFDHKRCHDFLRRVFDERLIAVHHLAKQSSRNEIIESLRADILESWHNILYENHRTGESLDEKKTASINSFYDNILKNVVLCAKKTTYKSIQKRWSQRIRHFELLEQKMDDRKKVRFYRKKRRALKNLKLRLDKEYRTSSE